MSDSHTETDLTFLENEDQVRTFIQLVTPLIQAAVRAETTPNNEAITKLVESELFRVRTEVQSTTSRNVEHFVDEKFAPLSKRLDDYLDNLNKEEKRRQEMFDQRLDQILSIVSETKQRTIENAEQIASVKATNDQRYEQILKDIANIRRDIDENVKSVSESARQTENSAKRMDQSLAKFFDKADKRIDKIEQNAGIVARDVVDLQSARRHSENRLTEIQDDLGNQRQDVDGLRADIATKVTTTELKVKHIDSELTEIKQRQSNQNAEQELVKKWVIDIQVQTKAAFWLLNTIPGRFILVTILALLGISNLVS